MTLTDIKHSWRDEESYHKEIHESFIEKVNADPFLKEYRDWIEQNVFGFGERSFLWLWKLIVDEMPSEFSFIELGVFRGQILAFIKALASATGRKVARFGVTPLDTSGDMWESDYAKDISTLHHHFFIPEDYQLYIGSSSNTDIINKAKNTAPYNICYIDGDHSYHGCLSDLQNYAPLVKQGGYLVIDDACTDMSQPWGFFQGIEDVTRATLEYLSGREEWEFYGNVVHLRVYKRV